MVDTTKVTMEKLDVHVPNNLEVQWAIVRPKVVAPHAKFKEYIVCSLYSPPASRKNRKMLDHLIATTHALMARYPAAAVFLGGDVNSLPLAPLIQDLNKL